jgi:hypothetical protein
MPIFRKNGQVSEKSRLDTTFDARPPEHRAADTAIDALRGAAMSLDHLEPPTDDPIQILIDAIHDNNRKIDLLLARRETQGKGVSGIKELMHSLTYGEMMELVSQLTACIPERHQEKGHLSEDWMPATLHAWASTQ